MTVLLTGAAGFIGMHVAAALLARGERVLGADDLNPYYDVRLKEARFAQLAAHEGFVGHRLDFADAEAVAALLESNPDVTRVVHLAAQAGVRYSLVNPGAYVRSNVVAQGVILE
ncbi:MAG: NAD-dependent epimerase/dehydratase family protein, partial [Geminicoccales bacterium]